MNETECFAAIGRKQVELDSLNTEYDRLLEVLKQVASGQIDPGRVSVDTAARTWAVAVPPPVNMVVAGAKALSTEDAQSDKSLQ